MVVSTNVPVNDLTLNLPDLRSRFQWGMSLRLHLPGDEDKLQLLQLRARRLGIELEEGVCQYILQRGQRSISGLMGVLAKLDRHSMQERRKITIPLVREVMGW